MESNGLAAADTGADRRKSHFKELSARRKSSAAVFETTLSATPEQKRRHQILSVVRFTVVLILLIVILLSLTDTIPLMDTIGDTVVEDIRDMGVGGGFCYMFMCAAFVVLCMPNALLAIAGGYIWENTVYGFLASYPGVIIGSIFSFWLGRVLFKEFLETELRGYLKFAALSHASEEHGYKVVFFGRLSPVPSGLLNYAFSVSGITYIQFIVSSMLGLIPIMVLYAKVGSDAYTYFETSELQEVVEQCRGSNYASVAYCCSADLAAIADQEIMLTGLQCSVNEILNDYDGEDLDACTALANENFQGYANCLASLDSDSCDGCMTCEFATLEDEAEDLECRYNDDDCSSESVNNNCLRDLNGSELWPKIVLPVFLFITLCIVGFFGNRALAKAGLLQVSYELDRQHELLMAEQEALNEAQGNPSV